MTTVNSWRGWFDLAPVHAAGELGVAAGGQDAGLLHPVLALDAALEVERMADAVDVLGGPVGDLLVGTTPIELSFFSISTPMPRMRFRSSRVAADHLAQAGGAPRRLGAGLGGLVGFRAHRAQRA